MFRCVFVCCYVSSLFTALCRRSKMLIRKDIITKVDNAFRFVRSNVISLPLDVHAYERNGCSSFVRCPLSDSLKNNTNIFLRLCCTRFNLRHNTPLMCHNIQKWLLAGTAKWQLRLFAIKKEIMLLKLTSLHTLKEHLYFLHASLLYIYYHKEEARLCVFTRHVHKSKIWRRKLWIMAKKCTAH